MRESLNTEGFDGPNRSHADPAQMWIGFHSSEPDYGSKLVFGL